MSKVLGRNVPTPNKINPTKGVKMGTHIGVIAYIPPNSQRFDINMVTDDGDIDLHMRVKFNEEHIRTNARIRGEWQTKRDHFRMYPLERGQGFELSILVVKDAYQICVDDREIMVIRRTLPLHRVTHLEICGDLKVIKVFESFDNLFENFHGFTPIES